MTTLKQKAISGVKWSAISQVVRQGAQIITTIVLARLLHPADFGFIGMAMVVIGFVTLFKDLGTSAAIIQRKELSDVLLATVFWVNVGFGTFAMIVLFLLAPLGGLIYREPAVIAILQVLSASFFISGFGILHQTLLERSLSFNTLAKLEVASVFAGAMVGIGLAFAGAGVWSLVCQTITTVSMATILLWLSNPWRPRLVFHWAEVKVVSSFSLNLIGFSIFNYFARNADYLLIGRYLGAQDLGYYTLAYRILLFPIQNISAVIGRVMYPVLSTMQDDNKRFADAYLKVVSSIAFISFPLMLGMLALAKPFVLTFFGEKWQPVVFLIMILAPVGLIQSIGTTVGAIYQVKGRTDWMFYWGIGSGFVAVAAFVVGLLWGINGVAVAYAVATLMLLFPSFAIPFRLVNMKFVQLLSALKASLLTSVLMFILLIILRTILPTLLSATVELIFFAAVGVIVYGLASWLINREQFIELWNLTGLQRIRIHEAG